MFDLLMSYSLCVSAADLLGINDVGRIRPDYIADMVVVQGDPLADISVLENDVVFVMQAGKVVRNDLNLSAL
jgi:imidazolonepropionase-like amidohydrolase